MAKRKQKRSRLALVGLDGVSYELLLRFTESGVMPNTAKLIRQYPLIRTVSPLPEVSPVSWTSMMTGMSPGEHSVFGFTQLDPRTYRYIFPHFPSLPVRTVWEKLAPEREAAIINLPHTYPARPLNGVLVSGFVAVDLERAVFPRRLVPDLKKINYRFDPDFSLIPGQEHRFLKDLESIMDTRWEFARTLFSRQWDFFVYIVTETDRINHFFYHASEAADHPYRQEFQSYYRRVDETVGNITGQLQRDGIPFLVVSDHGFVPLRYEVYLSRYLQEWGYLRFQETGAPGPPPLDLEAVTPDSRAFCLDPSRIYIHLKDKYSRGCVPAAKYQSIREELKQLFLQITIDQQPVLENVFFKEELYTGPYLDNAPDLVLLSRPGFDLKSGTQKNTLFGQTVFQGMHRHDNAICIDACGLDLDHGSGVWQIGTGIDKFLNHSESSTGQSLGV